MSKRPTSILFFQFWETISYILHPTRMLPSAAKPSSAVGLLGANQHPRSCGWRAESFWRRATEFRYLTMATWSSLRSRWTMQTNTNVLPQTPQAKERVLLQHWQFWVLFPTPMSRLMQFLIFISYMYYKILCLIEFTWLCSGINEIYMKNKNMLIEMKNWYT